MKTQNGQIRFLKARHSTYMENAVHVVKEEQRTDDEAGN